MASPLPPTGIKPKYAPSQRAGSWLPGQSPIQAYVNDKNDPNQLPIAPGQSWNYYLDPGVWKTDRISKKMADDALKAGIFYGTGYEGTQALERPQTQEDYAATQMYAHSDPITSLGFDPSVFNLKTSSDGSLDGDALLGEYTMSRPQETWDKFRGKTGSDQVELGASNLGDGQPVAFSPRVAAHESTHRGLSQMVDAMYGRQGSYFGLGSDGVQPWADTSKFSKEEMDALGQLRGIIDSSGSNNAENEWLTRMVEARFTGDPGTMLEVSGGKGKMYKQMTPADESRMYALLGNLETAAQKLVAQRRPGGPR